MEDTLNGTSGDDTLLGAEGNDVLFGLAGMDRLLGGTGDDAMFGGRGDDFYWVDSVGDAVIEQTDEGFDTVLSTVSYAIAGNVERLILTGDAAIDGLGSLQGDLIFGNGANNLLSGLGGDDRLDGRGGENTLIGGEGNDTLTGVALADELIGGNGDDVYILSGSRLDRSYLANTIFEAVGGGQDTLKLDFPARTQIDINGEFEKIVIATDAGLLVAFFGDNDATMIGGAGPDGLLARFGNDRLFGGDGDDFLYGDLEPGDGVPGDDTLVAGAGEDQLFGFDGRDQLSGGIADGEDDWFEGGAGDDLYSVYDHRDFAFELEDEGYDTVRVFFEEYHNFENIERVIIDERAPAEIAGGFNAAFGLGHDEIFIGSSAMNGLFGAGGDDRIFGRDGDDYLEGDYEGVVTSFDPDPRDPYGGFGDDTLIGGAGSDTLIGDEGDDHLRGGVADGEVDEFIGGPGNDSYFIYDEFDNIIEEENEGYDTAYVFGETFENFTSIERIIARGEGRVGIHGGKFDETIIGNGAIENFLLGAGGDDRIFGREGDDTLHGDSRQDSDATIDPNPGVPGNDTLVGGDGVNELVGGFGDDWLIADDGANIMIGGHSENVGLPRIGDAGYSAGADIYKFGRRVFDGDTTSPGAIVDFSTTDGDRIHLADIDADVSTPENDSFVYRGWDGPTGAAGELWFDPSDRSVLLANDGNRTIEIYFYAPEFNSAELTAAHFIL